ncbi:MAG: hypothetical protein WAP53_06510 [Dysgonamonadaceae bacterium]|jgi:hypothetical protein|nr:hypothetical protein [Dysgonamonadaceae bacterium]
MPYRRLPNTDIARIRALKTAIEKCLNTDFREVAIEMKTLQEAKNVLSRFERIYNQYQQAFDTQVKANILFQQKAKNARMYLSHFVQVLYMCVIRSEIKTEYLELYGLENQNMIVPDFSSNERLLEWGEKIIKGEESRIAEGGVPIFNPTIAKVKVMFSLFEEGYQTQKIHQKATLRLQNQVTEAREKVDKVIFDIWEQVERKNKDLPLNKRLERNREYGVVYYYRKGETVEE